VNVTPAPVETDVAEALSVVVVDTVVEDPKVTVTAGEVDAA
jgi:hypothetical protein